MLCYVMLCYVILCYVMLCYVMSCYITKKENKNKENYKSGNNISYLRESVRTCRPSAILMSVVRMTSAARNPSGRTMRLTAESSRVRSNHWLACVCAAFYGWENERK
jgi:hypothetical protein